ncbi:MAG: hypothetical protein QOI24_2738 [Acidobacteriota bacterium]|jgi:hypothetical protein|nr:hypothetical protein [Acidobacteriota bacterium]
MTSSAFLIFHVVLSLIAIGAGFVVVWGMLTGRRLDSWNAYFLGTTIATSVTGFGFPFHGFKPPHYVGVLSLIVLAIACLARYRFHLEGSWRRVYIITALIALWFNVFVGVVQSFLKIPALHALAPKGSEPPFAIAQSAVLLIFIAIGVLAVRQRYSMPISST